MVGARITRADQDAFGEAQAHWLQNALEPGHEVLSASVSGGSMPVSAARTTRRPETSPAASFTRRAGGFVAFPQGSIAPQARAGSDPGPVAEGLA